MVDLKGRIVAPKAQGKAGVGNQPPEVPLPWQVPKRGQRQPLQQHMQLMGTMFLKVGEIVWHASIPGPSAILRKCGVELKSLKRRARPF